MLNRDAKAFRISFDFGTNIKNAEDLEATIRQIIENVKSKSMSYLDCESLGEPRVEGMWDNYIEHEREEPMKCFNKELFHA